MVLRSDPSSLDSEGTRVIPTAASSRLFVFGPQCLSFDQQSANCLRSQLQRSDELIWILDALSALPCFWDTLKKSVSVLQQSNGQTHLQKLAIWIRTGDPERLAWPLPNVLLTPLVVALHMVELKKAAPFMYDNADPSSHIPARVLGLCTGLLSSMAVACSNSWSELKHNGSAAIRLAMLIGAVVDAVDESLPQSSQAASLSVFWTQNGGRQKLESVIEAVDKVSP